jgi:hypothetical protein
MTSIAQLADELAVSPGDIRMVLVDLYGAVPGYAASGLLSDSDADDVRAVLDPDGLRTTR